MSIQDRQQLEVTREKLQRLEDRLRSLNSEPIVNPVTRELTKRSLKKLVNQMKEEITLFNARRAPALT